MTVHFRTGSLIAVVLAGLTSGSNAQGEESAGGFTVKRIGAGTYAGHQGKIDIAIEQGEKKEIVTVVGDMPVGAGVGFHYHPGYALVSVTKGKVASFDSAECEPSHVYDTGEAFLDFPGHKHDIVNIGDEAAQFVVTFLLPARSRFTQWTIRAGRTARNAVKSGDARAAPPFPRSGRAGRTDAEV